MHVGIFVRLLTYKANLEALDEDTEVNNENQELIAVADDIQKHYVVHSIFRNRAQFLVQPESFILFYSFIYLLPRRSRSISRGSTPSSALLYVDHIYCTTVVNIRSWKLSQTFL